MKVNRCLSGENLTIRVENSGPLWALEAMKRALTTTQESGQFFVCTYQSTLVPQTTPSWAGIQKAIG